MELTNLTAVVTGGAKGLGLGIAQGLLSRGCKVQVWDMDEAAIAELGPLLEKDERLSARRIDVTDSAAVLAAAAQIPQTDILINNAGIGGDRLLVKMDEWFWDRVISVNLKSQFLCTKALVPGMIERGFGRIINISSRAWLGNRGQTSYSASKGAVVSFTRSLALEFARNGITANAIAPGIHETPLFRTAKLELQQQLKESVPMQRIGQPEDIANAVCFFASPASSYVTGQTLYVCGGRSLGGYSA